MTRRILSRMGGDARGAERCSATFLGHRQVRFHGISQHRASIGVRATGVRPCGLSAKPRSSSAPFHLEARSLHPCHGFVRLTGCGLRLALRAVHFTKGPAPARVPVPLILAKKNWQVELNPHQDNLPKPALEGVDHVEGMEKVFYVRCLADCCVAPSRLRRPEMGAQKPRGRACPWVCRRNYLNNVSVLQELAGAGGFEPPHGGIKIPCLTTWRRPNGRAGPYRRGHSHRSAPLSTVLEGSIVSPYTHDPPEPTPAPLRVPSFAC